VSSDLLLGIDLGGTKTLLALADQQGTPIASKRFPTALSGSSAKDLTHLKMETAGFLSEQRVEPSQLLQIGISAPGPLDPERGILFSAPNLQGWRDVPLQAFFQESLATATRLENDANAAALAEWQFGAGQGARSMVYLTMSTGIGGGLILDGRLFRGEACSAGELGHVPVEWDGELCNCGQRGCLEAYIGGAAWQKRLRRVTPEDSQVTQLAGSSDLIQPEHVVQAAREGDAFALSEMERFNHYLSRAIVGLAFSLAPERIVLGTIAVAAGEELCFAPLRKLVAERIWPSYQEHLQILPASLGKELPERAGVCVALDALQDRG
jgi:glucokinase